jgi:uncharacterized membrane protein YfcA
MTILDGLLLFAVAIIGGAINAVAGGGTFFTVPALIFTDVPAVLANTTSTFAIWTAAISSAGAYRKELARQPRFLLISFICISLTGGIIGAILLLSTSNKAFVQLLPYLLLIATLLFAVGPLVTTRLRLRSIEEKTQPSRKQLFGILFAQFLASIYGGYFGGGVGIVMLALFALLGMSDIHSMNALKTLLNLTINGIAVVIFIVQGAILWPQAILMAIGAIIGGYGGAYYARKLKQSWIRWFVIAFGLSMSLYFFIASR